MPRRIWTAREQYELWSPWREAMPTYYHVTNKPDFKLNPDFTPEHIGYDPGDSDEEPNAGPGVYLTQNPDLWRHNYPGRSERPYNAQFDTNEDLKDYPEMTPGWDSNDREMGINPEQYFVPSDYFHMLKPKGVHEASWDDELWNQEQERRNQEEDDAWNSRSQIPPKDPDLDALWRRDSEAEDQARQDALNSGYGSAEDDAHDELAQARNRDWATYENLIPPKDSGRNGARPPMTMEPVSNWMANGVMARHAADGRPIGHLMWTPDGEISTVNTHPDFEGRGIANAMLHHARSNPEIYHNGEYPIHHSDKLSPAGERWARSDPHHTMPRNFTPVELTHGAGSGSPYTNYLSGDGSDPFFHLPEFEYIPAKHPYNGQTEDFMKAQEFTKPGSTLYGKKNPPPRQYVPPGQGHLGEHWGSKAATMDWGRNG